MTKSALVKVGLPSEQAESIKGLRHIRQILEQHDVALARLTATTNERIREAVSGGDNADTRDAPAPVDDVAATA